MHAKGVIVLLEHHRMSSIHTHTRTTFPKPANKNRKNTKIKSPKEKSQKRGGTKTKQPPPQNQYTNKIGEPWQAVRSSATKGNINYYKRGLSLEKGLVIRKKNGNFIRIQKNH